MSILDIQHPFSNSFIFWLRFNIQYKIESHFSLCPISHFSKNRHDLDTIIWQIQTEKHLITERGTV